MHAEIQIGGSPIMIADEAPWRIAKSPQSLGGTSVFIRLFVEDVDALAAKAVAAGAKVLLPIRDQPYGDRSGSFQDPFGHTWTLATHQEDVSPEEVGRRLGPQASEKARKA